jgi:hypothetical protein
MRPPKRFRIVSWAGRDHDPSRSSMILRLNEGWVGRQSRVVEDDSSRGPWSAVVRQSCNSLSRRNLSAFWPRPSLEYASAVLPFAIPRSAENSDSRRVGGIG